MPRYSKIPARVSPMTISAIPDDHIISTGNNMMLDLIDGETADSVLPTYRGAAARGLARLASGSNHLSRVSGVVCDDHLALVPESDLEAVNMTRLPFKFEMQLHSRTYM